MNYILDKYGYDKHKGLFNWNSEYRNRDFIEPKDFGFKLNTGKLAVQIDSQKYKLCELAFLKVYGYIPEIIDIIDRDNNNLRINNLKDITDIVNCKTLNQENLKKILNYNKKTGIFTWNINNGHKEIGKIAGGFVKGKPCSITVFGRQVFAHILVILYVEGYIPDQSKSEVVDHINRNKNDNSYKNLRVVYKGINNKNTKKRKDNTSGYTGIYFSNNKIRAKIGSEYLGTFESIEEAIKTRRLKMKEYSYTDDHGDLA